VNARIARWRRAWPGLKPAALRAATFCVAQKKTPREVWNKSGLLADFQRLLREMARVWNGRKMQRCNELPSVIETFVVVAGFTCRSHFPGSGAAQLMRSFFRPRSLCAV
jgi:hypothetical protein